MHTIGLCTGLIVLLTVKISVCRPFASEFEVLTDDIERLMNDVKRSVDADEDTDDASTKERDAVPAKTANETTPEGSIVKDASTADESSPSTPSNVTVVSASSNAQASEKAKPSDTNGVTEAVKDDFNAKEQDGEKLTAEQGVPVQTSADLKDKEKDSDKSADAKSTEPALKSVEKASSEAVDSGSKSSSDKDSTVQPESSKIQSSESSDKAGDSKTQVKSDVEEASDEQNAEQQSKGDDVAANSQETQQDASIPETAADVSTDGQQGTDDSVPEDKSADQRESSSDQVASQENPGKEDTEEAAAGAAVSETDDDKVKMFFISPFEEDGEFETPEGTEEAQARQILTYPATGHGWGHSHQWGPSHIWNSDYPYFAYGYSWGCGHHGYGPHHSLKKSGVSKSKGSDTICRDYLLIPASPRASVIAPRDEDGVAGDQTGTVRQVVSKDVACSDDDPQCTARQVIGSMAGGSMFGDGMGGLGIGFPGIPGIHTGVSGYNEAGGFGDHMHGHHGHHGGYGIGSGGYGHFIGGNDHGFSSFWGNRGRIATAAPKEESPEKKTKVKKGSKAQRRNFGVWGGPGFGQFGMNNWGSGGFAASMDSPMFAGSFGARPGLNYVGYPGWGSFNLQNWGGQPFARNLESTIAPLSVSAYGYGSYGNGYNDDGGFGRPFLEDSRVENGELSGYGGGLDDGEAGSGIGYADFSGLVGSISHGAFHSPLTYKSKIKRKHEGKKENEGAKTSSATTRQDIAMPDEQALMDVTKQRQLIGSLGASTLFGDNVGGIGLGHPGVPQMSSGVSGIPGEYGGSGGYSHGWEGHGPGMHPHGYNDYGYNFGHEDGEHDGGYDKSTTPHGQAEEQGQKKQMIFPGSLPAGNVLSAGNILPGRTHAPRHFGDGSYAGTQSSHLISTNHIPAVPVTVQYSGYNVGPSPSEVLDREFSEFADRQNNDYEHAIAPIGVVDHGGYENIFGPINHVANHELHHEIGDHYGGELIHESHQVAHIAPAVHGEYDPLIVAGDLYHNPRHVHVGVGTPNVKVEVETDKSKIEKPLSHFTVQKMSEIKRLVTDVSNSIKKTGEKLKAMKKGRVAADQQGKRQITPAFTPVTAEPVGVPDIRYPVPAADRYPLGAGYIWPSANYGHQYGGPYAWSKSHTPSAKTQKGAKTHKRHKAHKKGRRSTSDDGSNHDSDKKKSVAEKKGKPYAKRQFVSRNEMFERRPGYPYHGGMSIYGYGMGYPVHGAGAGAAYGAYAGHGSYGMEGYGAHGLGGHGIAGYGAYGAYGHGLGGHADGMRYLGSFAHGDIDHGMFNHGGYFGGHGGLEEGYGHGGVVEHGYGGYEGHHAYGGYLGHGGAFSGGYEGHGIASVPVAGMGGIGGYGHGFESIHGGDIAEHAAHGGFGHFGELGPLGGEHSPFGESHAANGLHYVGGIGGYGGIGGVGGLGGIAALGGHEAAYPGYGLGGHAGYGNGYGFARQEIEGNPQGEGASDMPMASMSRSQMPEGSMMVPETQQAEFAPDSMVSQFAGYPGSKKSVVPDAKKESQLEKPVANKVKA